MATVLRELTCANCGSNVTQYNAASQTLVCQTCNSHIDAGDGQIIGKSESMIPAPKPINLGQTGIFNGVECIVLGRVYHEGWSPNDKSDRWTWTEWLLGAEDGRMFWLSYDNEAGFVLSQKRRIKMPFNPLTDRLIPLAPGGAMVRVKERYPARIVAAEGELNWRAKPNDTLTMIEANGHGREYSIQFSKHELELYEGVALSDQQVAEAFGNTKWIKRTAQRARNQELFLLSGVAALAFGIVALILAAAFFDSGTLTTTETVSVNREAPSAFVAFDVNATNRPMMIKLVSSSLPLNSWAEVEVSVTDPTERETFIASNEFWHETGVDDGGRWQESDYSGSAKFIPVEAGLHTLKLDFEDADTGVNGTTLTVEIYRDHIVYTWLLIYGIAVPIIGIILIAMSNPKKVGQLIAAMSEDD